MQAHNDSPREEGSPSMHIKVRNGEDLRRFDAKIGNFRQLDRRMRRCFGLEPEAALKIRYKDDENDLCSITNNEELAMAIRGIDSTGGILRLELTTAAASPPPPAAVAADDCAVAPQKNALETMLDEASNFVKNASRHVHVHAARAMDGRRGGPRGFGPRGHGHGHGGRHGGGRYGGRHGGGHKKHGGGCPWRRGAAQARFVADVSGADGMALEAGTKLTKTWLVANPAREAWPVGTTLLRVGGDDTGGAQVVSVPVAAPGTAVDISIEVNAPAEPGRYVSYWRLQDTEGRRFGQRFWFMFTVGAEVAAGAEVTAEDAARAEQQAGHVEVEVEAEEEAAAAEPAEESQPAVADDDQALKELGDALLAGKITAVQAKAAVAAYNDGVHLGIVCDVTGAMPITGTRYSRKAGDDTYDVCEDGYQSLEKAERDTLRAMPHPEVAILIKNLANIPVEEEDIQEEEEEGQTALVHASPEPCPEEDPDEQPTVTTRLASQFGLAHDEAAAFVSASDMEEDLISALLEGSLVAELEPSVRNFQVQAQEAEAMVTRAAELEAERIVAEEAAAEEAARAAAEVEALRVVAEDAARLAAEQAALAAAEANAARLAAAEAAAAAAGAEAARLAAEQAAAAEAEAAHMAELENARIAATPCAPPPAYSETDSDGFVAVDAEFEDPAAQMVAQMTDMGFADEAAVRDALQENGFDVARAIAYMLRN